MMKDNPAVDVGIDRVSYLLGYVFLDVCVISSASKASAATVDSFYLIINRSVFFKLGFDDKIIFTNIGK